MSKWTNCAEWKVSSGATNRSNILCRYFLEQKIKRFMDGIVNAKAADIAIEVYNDEVRYGCTS